jgi:hypothetical protein
MSVQQEGTVRHRRNLEKHVANIMHFYATKLLACGFVSLISILFHNAVTNFAYVKSNIHMRVDKRSRSNLCEGKQPWAD